MSTSDKHQRERPIVRASNVRHEVPQIPNPYGIRITRYRQFDSLQGYIHCGVYGDDNKKIVIKQTLKQLVQQKISRNGHRIHENFHEEKRILLYLSNQNDLDTGICRIVNNFVWEDKTSYYYAMQHCVAGLFDYIQGQFDKHKNGTMDKIINNPNYNDKPYMPWVTKIQNIFRKLCRSVAYCHSKGIAHLDLSLENALLFDERGGVIKLIDFGVSHDMRKHNGSWISNKRVGKTNYMPPEVYAMCNYDSRKVDVWTLGVMLFMCLVGSPPYVMPIVKKHSGDVKGDLALTFLLRGKLEKILNKWHRAWMVSDDAMDLMIQIFKTEKNRITMNDLLAHPFVGLALECDGSMTVNQCPHIARTVQVLNYYNDGLLNEFNFATVRLLNDFNHILKDHIAVKPHEFHEIYNVLIQTSTNHRLIDINASNIFQRLYRERHTENNNDDEDDDKSMTNEDCDFDDTLYEYTQVAVLDKIYCYFVYSTHMMFDIERDNIQDIRSKKHQLKQQSVYPLIQRKIDDERYKFMTCGWDHIVDEDTVMMQRDDDSKQGDIPTVYQLADIDRTVSSEQDYYDITTPIFYNFKSIISKHLKDDTMGCQEFLKFIENVVQSSDELNKEIPSVQLKLILNELESSNMDELQFVNSMSSEKFRTKLMNIQYSTLKREPLYKLHQEIIKSINLKCQHELETLTASQLVQLIYKVLCEEYGMNLNDTNRNYDIDNKLRSMFVNGNIDGLAFSMMSNTEICQLLSQCIHCYDRINNEHIFSKRFHFFHKHDRRFVQDIYNGLELGHWFVNRKYNNLKQELLHNNIVSFTSHQWKQILFYVSNVLAHTIQVKKYKAGIHSNNLMYTVGHNEPIKLSHLICLYIYANDPTFTKPFIQSFTHQINAMNYRHYESWINVMRYHHEVANFAFLLRETVECYGEFGSLSNRNRYYHLMDKSTITLHSNYLRYNAPISATTKALNVCYTDISSGVIMCLAVAESTSRLKCFDLQFISDFPCENEVLFIGGLGSLKVQNIMIRNENDIGTEYKVELLAIDALYKMVCAQDNIQNAYGWPVCNALFGLIRNKLQLNKKEVRCTYMDRMFSNICGHILKFRNVTIDMQLLLASQDIFYITLREIWFDSKTRRIRYDLICKLFGKNIDKINVLIHNDQCISKQLSIFDNDSLMMLQNSKLCTFEQINFIGCDHMEYNVGNLMQKYDALFQKNRCFMKFYALNGQNTFTIHKKYH
eukprot:296158_1